MGNAGYRMRRPFVTQLMAGERDKPIMSMHGVERADPGGVDPRRVESAPRMDGMEERLRSRFGLPSFHPWQREAIDALLEGSRRVLVVAPTGGGKSLCYQFPATELEGTSIVISPLIALMEDQVRSLTERGVPATFLASTLDMDERRERERRIAQGEFKLVYVAPERLANPSALESLRRAEPPLVAIDEAHCISQWGHDFRPDYLRLGRILEQLAPKHVLACTATATPVVREEILARLHLGDEAKVVLRGFARPNLHFEALELDSMPQRRAAMIDIVRTALGSPDEPKGAAIVYAATRKNSERMAEALRGVGFAADAYHAGLPNDVRANVNRRFAAGELDVVAATNAFGMGIDRADIRAVVHVQCPGSIEGYYQEVGRAGRDGQPARGVLLASSSDMGLRRRLLERSSDPMSAPPRERVERQWQLFLDLMRYVEAGSCRHDFILRYFGDEQELLGGCGHCDVCERLEAAGDEGERVVSDEDALTVRKALSGVARCHDRVGMRMVAEMLAGKDNAKTQRMGLTRLSTFGLLGDRHPEWLLALLRRLITAGLMEITPDEYPLVLLTRAGVPVMRGDEPVRVLLPDAGVGGRRAKTKTGGKRKKGAPPELAAEHVALFDALRDARREVAADRSVPPYVVCHDRTLAEIATSRPATADELMEVHGMGPARLESVGDLLLQVVRDHT